MSVHSPVASPTTSVSQWSEKEVARWLAGIGLAKLAPDFAANGITGDVLVLLDDDALKDIGVTTVGQRLALLSGIYRLKTHYGIAIQEGDWLPKSVTQQSDSSAARIHLLESQVSRLTEYLQRFQHDVASLSRHVGHSSDAFFPLQSPTAVASPSRARADERMMADEAMRAEQSSSANSLGLGSRSAARDAYTQPTSPYTDLSPTQPLPPVTGTMSSATSPVRRLANAQLSAPDHNARAPSTSRLTAAELSPKAVAASTSASDSNPYKSFRVTLDCPCHKVLPAALKKYKINDDWRKYALFICYGKTERCLSYDEKPLLLFQKLKESEQNPVFMLRHIRDVKSPIAIAEAKAETKVRKEASKRSDGRTTGEPPPGVACGKPVEMGPAADIPERIRQTKSYAVAIYPYMRERDDEFEVAVGDTYVVINKARGWWIVVRDGAGDGSGDVEYSVATNGEWRAERVSGWVPAGCLIETSRPLEEMSRPVDHDERSTRNSTSSTRWIPPGCIVSTSTPGVMLMDYESADSGLNLRKDERLRVFKRYNHWSYCVQEGEGHGRGWVPSWYIGKREHKSSSPSLA